MKIGLEHIFIAVIVLCIVGMLFLPCRTTRYYYSDADLDAELSQGQHYWVVRPKDAPNRVMLVIDANDIRAILERRKDSQ